MSGLQDFESLESWAGSRLSAAGRGREDLAIRLGHSGGLSAGFWRKPIPVTDWPALALGLNVRFDELVVVIEYFHPDWIESYRRFVRFLMQYLVWRSEITEGPGFSGRLARVAIEELLEPTINPYLSDPQRRAADGRGGGPSERPKRRPEVLPRRLADLIDYLKHEAAET